MDRKRPRARRFGGSTWLRVVTLAVPAGAVALAGAFVALRPHPDHQRQVRTADNGITAPAPTNDGVEPSPGAPQQPSRGTATASPSSPTTTAPARATTTTVEPTRHLVVPAPTDQSPQTTAEPKRSPEPTTSTTAAPTTTTTTPTATLSLHCTGGTDAGSAAVTCTWSPATTSAFKSYRLSREKPGTNRVVVFTTDNRSTTSYADHDVQAGTGYGYWVEALDANGNVIARGAATVSCC
jgi:hypothetical protein